MESVFFWFLSLWLIASFMALWSEKILEMISILLNMLRLVLCPWMCQSLRLFRVLLKRMYLILLFFFFGCNILKMSVKSNFFIVLFRISVALLIFCLEDLSIDVSGVLMSPTISVSPLISSFMALSIWVCMGAPLWGAYILMMIITSSWMTLF